MSDEPKFCKDCKHYKEAWAVGFYSNSAWASGPETCNQPLERELIHGRKIPAVPQQMREERGACKPAGLLWEEKPAPAPVDAPAPPPEVPVRFMAQFGTASSDERYIERDGWLQHQSRKVMRDTNGAITERGEWADCGGRTKLPDDFLPIRWWEFCK